MRCLSCQYDLRNLTSGGGGRCPECGREFDPNDPTTYALGTSRFHSVFVMLLGIFGRLFTLLLSGGLCIAFIVWSVEEFMSDRSSAFIALGGACVTGLATAAAAAIYYARWIAR